MEGDDFVLRAGGSADFADFASEFNGGFVGFAAGVADEDFGGGVHRACGACFGNDLFGEFAGPGVIVKIGRVHKCESLVVHNESADSVYSRLRSAPVDRVIWPFLDQSDREH